MPEEAERFILANTAVSVPPHTSEIRLHLASEAHELWLKTEDELAGIGLPPPFWAFAWAGGQGLARFLIDHPESVRGKRALDFATGSGLVAIAAAKAGAARVKAADSDPFARAAIRLNAALNGVSITFTGRDMIGEDIDADLLLAGDIFYDRALAARVLPWFEHLAGRDVSILVGDPGRSYFPPEKFEALATYHVPVTRALEDAEVKRTTVWKWRGR
ncbi:MAG TPA: methyltransferase [Mesorhizobium sp.]|nr:methyltransferase [Mesorhizobium sp.]